MVAFGGDPSMPPPNVHRRSRDTVSHTPVLTAADNDSPVS
jgi:hypothetical protein